VNSAERFVFAQMYETLVDVDCDGRAYPGLARSWAMDATRTRLSLVIHDGARFWNGEAVRAPDVVAAWRATGEQSGESSRLARQLADAATIVDDRTLIVSLPDTAWRVLADPALAVYRPQAGPAWPEGSGPYRVAERPGSTEPLTLAPVSAAAGPYVAIRSRPNADARDAIDAAVDVLVTGDPVAMSYAATHSNLTAVPLPWRRTYALGIASLGSNSAVPLVSLLRDIEPLEASLSRDAVHAEARPAEVQYWLANIQGCTSKDQHPDAARGAGTQSNRIVYRRGDRAAQGIAERLVALGRGLTAAGLAPGEFARSLHAGDNLAYVLQIPRLSLAPCRDLAVLESDAPWLAGGVREGIGSPEPTPLFPLIDTRDRAIVDRNHVSATIDWDGTLRLRGGPHRP